MYDNFRGNASDPTSSGPEPGHLKQQRFTNSANSQSDAVSTQFTTWSATQPIRILQPESNPLVGVEAYMEQFHAHAELTNKSKRTRV